VEIKREKGMGRIGKEDRQAGGNKKTIKKYISKEKKKLVTSIRSRGFLINPSPPDTDIATVFRYPMRPTQPVARWEHVTRDIVYVALGDVLLLKFLR
jgi:hypothetical protein